TGRVATARAGRARRGDDVGERGVRGELDRPAVQPGLAATGGAADVLAVRLEAAGAALAAVAEVVGRAAEVVAHDGDRVVAGCAGRGLAPAGLAERPHVVPLFPYATLFRSTGRVATARAGRARRGDDVGERGVRGELDRPAVQPGL